MSPTLDPKRELRQLLQRRGDLCSFVFSSTLSPEARESTEAELDQIQARIKELAPQKRKAATR